MLAHINSRGCEDLCYPVCILWDRVFKHFFNRKHIANESPFCRYIVAHLSLLSENCIKIIVFHHNNTDNLPSSTALRTKIQSLARNEVD
jgi:hypothetical protein